MVLVKRWLLDEFGKRLAAYCEWEGRAADLTEEIKLRLREAFCRAVREGRAADSGEFQDQRILVSRGLEPSKCLKSDAGKCEP